jgi:hypothetical protein
MIAVATARERVGLYPGFKRANSTRLWATTADQTYALKWSSPRHVQRLPP